MSVELSPGTIERVNLLFNESERQAVIKLIKEACGSNLPFCENTTPEQSERIPFAVLKLSEGNFAKLERAILIAKSDWRDVLVASGFGNSVTIHNEWWPNKL